VSAILRNHIEQLEQTYCKAMKRALDRLEEYEERRYEAFKKALEGLDLEAEKQKIRRIMNEIQAKNSRSVRS